jgi:hypothetical protein
MKRIVMLGVTAGIIFLSGATVRAEGGDGQAPKERAHKDGQAKKAPEELKDFTVSGTMMAEVTVQKKDNREVTRYYVAMADGTKAFLAGGHAKRAQGNPGGVAPQNPADFLNKQVSVVGKGVEKEGKKGKTITLSKVESIVEVVAVP